MASASHSPAAAPVTAVKGAVLGSLTAELDKIAPRFEVDAERIQIISGPSEFYSALKVPLFKMQDPTDGERCSSW